MEVEVKTFTLGLSPFVLIKPRPSGDPDDIDMDIEYGGGLDQVMAIEVVASLALQFASQDPELADEMRAALYKQTGS